MIPACPNNKCIQFQKKEFQKKDGKYYRRDDRHFIQRYKCQICSKKYSSSTRTLEYRQKKRTVNRLVKADLSSGVSIRRCAYKIGIHRTTVARKLIYLAKKARLNQSKVLEQLRNQPVQNIQFDDLISSIHTKLKPVSISVVIDSNRRLILGASVSEIPSFGLLAKLSKSKYGYRKNMQPENLNTLLTNLKFAIHPNAIFKTDEHNKYPEIILKNYPEATHQQFKSKRASVAGLGELKNKSYDPLFMINHTLAMLRANINRLFRRTWCTSKKQESLQDHVDIFIDFFNQMIIEKNKIKL